MLVEIPNPFIPEIVDGITGVLEPSNCKAVIGMGYSATVIKASLIETMIDNWMDGLIPMVAIGHHEASASDFDTVNADYHRGVKIVIETLLARGHSDIAMLSHEDPNATPANVVYQRERAYLAVMQAQALARQSRILHLPRGTQEHLDAIDTVLVMQNRPRAVFVWSDLDAILLINAAKMAGIKVPEDLAIVGYDNTRVAALPLINLTSIDPFGRRLGALATETLLTRIRGRTEPQHQLNEPALVLRQSI